MRRSFGWFAASVVLTTAPLAVAQGAADEAAESAAPPTSAPAPAAAAAPVAEPQAPTAPAESAAPAPAAAQAPAAPAVGFVPPPTGEPTLDEPDEPDDGSLGSHQQHLLVALGVRSALISDEGFDPFSDQDAFTQLTLHAGSTVLTEGRLSLAVLLGWDYGEASDSARGSDSELNVHRLWVGAEGRYHFLRRLYGYGRLAPALLNTAARLRDPVIGSDRSASAWTFGFDASLGAAFELFGQPSGSSRTARGWVGLEGGYGYATSTDLVLEAPDSGAAPIRTASVDLGDLAVRGPFTRLEFGLTF